MQQRRHQKVGIRLLFDIIGSSLWSIKSFYPLLRCCEVAGVAIFCSGSRVAENKNVRRENKAYSHKEQMEFLQLQKEIEAKRSKE